MVTDIASMRADLLAQIDAAATPEVIEAVRVAALGKSGSVTGLLKTLGAMTPEQRQAEGPRIHGLREAVTEALTARKSGLERAALDTRLATETLDMTLPVDVPPTGTIHPVSQVMDELAEIFADLGFAVATGPEIENDWYNFTALNIPETHPARAMHDTFYLEEPRAAGGGQSPPSDGDGFADAAARAERMVLRTHTSPVQIRAMQAAGGDKPIRIIAPGRTYRSDSDATHTPMFHQVEGLVIDKGITLGHLKWTLETFLKAFFERDDIVLRLRPSYFPFTEPSAEVDVGYSMVNGKRVIGGSGGGNGGGWMEVLGSGMVHRKVIAAGGYDPDEWQGFAFGCGIDRLAMLKYGMDDLRAFFDGDVRWLKHYGFSGLDVPTLSGGVGA
ncbi:phenylalanine--tRNA ligase subunit alpha [Sphingomonas bacterium]|uniref:phenylalanine--tRNA ligase subunit alpha n=1 Tax=Sphingomonas bacterium TaxID=1895847 RepID=UPI00261096DF|nr:phenylalanine--tRNA ligase subunit alpha [Sphingomonas bacterium]MDB5679901.1 phenylalanine--tRNA ligase subunit alpha [Sphingomonas bacterium]